MTEKERLERKKAQLRDRIRHGKTITKSNPREVRNGVSYDSMPPEVKAAYDAALQNKKDNAANR
nr:hypothetical protein [Carnobacterium maltaromaticum]